MIKSMTGYAQTTFADQQFQMTLSVKTVNNRFLDINLRMNSALTPLEDRIKSYVSSRLSRGRVDLSLQLITQEKMENGNLAVNWSLARTYGRLLTELKEQMQLSGSLSVTDFLSLKDLFVYEEKALSEEALWTKLASALKRLFDGLQKMRVQEGKHLSADLVARLKTIQQGTDLIAHKVPKVVEAYQVRLKERIQKLTKGIEIDPARLAQEVAIMADRSDVSEELTRLGSHVKQFKTLFKETLPVGKKMEFLLQEMNREVNTIGSKSPDSEVSHLVVGIKAELEKIREQVQNIE
jgi:uncharacterized protein (TIGR00255 family)